VRLSAESKVYLKGLTLWAGCVVNVDVWGTVSEGARWMDVCHQNGWLGNDLRFGLP
jgi:hypothetical protein